VTAPAIGKRRGFLPPPTAKVNWTHPLAQGLEAFIIPLYRKDLTGRHLITDVGAMTHARNKYGPGLSGATATTIYQYIDAVNNQIILGANATFTITALVTWVAGGTGTCPMYCERGTSELPIVKFEVNASSSNALSVVYRDDGNNLIDSTGGSPSLTDGQSYTFHMVRRSLSTFEGWTDGLLRVVPTPNGSMTAAFTATNVQCRIGSDKGDTSNAFVGCINAIILRKRDLSAAEIAAEVADPFAVLRW
jgi:hypothetical protein